MCQGWFLDKDTQVDHIEECGSLRSWEDLTPFARRLFVEVDGLNVQCLACHAIKTQAKSKSQQDAAEAAAIRPISEEAMPAAQPAAQLNEAAFEALAELQEGLRLVQSTKSKQANLQEAMQQSTWPAVADLIKLALDPQIVFYVTSEQLRGGGYTVTAPESDSECVRWLFDGLAARRWSERKEIHSNIIGAIGHWGLSAQSAFWAVLDKSLDCGVDYKTWNTVAPPANRVEAFSVALGEIYTNQPVWTDETRWFVSRKFDGIRSIITIDSHGGVSCRSRGNKSQDTSLTKLIPAIADLGLRDVVLDGEIALATPNGEDDFRGVASAMGKKSTPVPNPRYWIFDILTTGEFNSGSSDRLLSERLLQLRDVIPDDSEMLRRVKQVVVKDEQTVSDAIVQAESHGWEGIVLRKDAPYIGKRSGDILKVKGQHDIELEVVRLENGTMSFLVDDVGPLCLQKAYVADPVRFVPTGQKRKEMLPCLAAAIVSYEGTEVGVGSGWTPTQRLVYHAKPEKLLGCTLTVQYTEISQNKVDDSLSLRFPRVKAVHHGKRTD